MDIGSSTIEARFIPLLEMSFYSRTFSVNRPIDFENLSFMCGCTLANFQSAQSNQDDFESFMCAHARYNRIQTCMNCM